MEVIDDFKIGSTRIIVKAGKRLTEEEKQVKLDRISQIASRAFMEAAIVQNNKPAS